MFAVPSTTYPRGRRLLRADSAMELLFSSDDLVSIDGLNAFVFIPLSACTLLQDFR